MTDVSPADCRPTVKPVVETLAPLDLPFFSVKAVEAAFAAEAGATLDICQALVLENLASQREIYNDPLVDNNVSAECITDPTIVEQVEHIRSRVQSLTKTSLNVDDIATAPYGAVADELVRSHQLRLKLDALSNTVGQAAMRGTTVCHGFIPAELLEGPGDLGFHPEQLVADLLYDFWRAFPETGFSFVRLVGWMELALIENPTGDKGDCLGDWWCYRGRDFFRIKEAPVRSYGLHLHAYGVARRAGHWASAKAITKSLKEFFPCSDAVMTKEFDLKKTAATNIGRIGRYRSKLMGNVRPHRLTPSGPELAANVRFWSRCATQSRDFTIVEDWPEIGARRPKPLDDPDLMKRVSDAWTDAEKAWTPQSPFLTADSDGEAG